MSRIRTYDELLSTVEWECSACLDTHTTAAGAAKPVPVEAGPPVLMLSCQCGALVFVPFNDWNDPELVPEVEAEKFNQLFYMRAQKAPHPQVQLIALDKALGPSASDGSQSVVPLPPEDRPDYGLAGERVPAATREVTERLARRKPDGSLVGGGEV